MIWPFKKKETPKPAQSSKRMYAAAVSNRLTSDWITSTTSADAEVRTSIRTVRNRARDLARDNDYMKQFLRLVENNVIGQGIPFQAQVKMQRGGKLNDQMNDMIETAWESWTNADSCHTAGFLAFQDIEKLIMRSVAQDGEFYVRLIRKKFGKSKVPLALELIEADYLDENYNATASSGNEIRMGVEIDIWGRRVAYHFHPKHPGDQSFATRQGPNTNGMARLRVPADEIIPLFIPERSQQTRGMPWVHTAMKRLRNMGGYEEATIVTARAAAAQMGFIQSPEGELRGDGEYDGDLVTDFEPGVFKYLAPGETVVVPPVTKPSGELDPFMRLMLRGVAAGTGVSYESISRDFTGTSYSSARASILDERDNWKALQAWVIRSFHKRVFCEWMELAVLAGALDLPGYETAPEKYEKVKWMPRGWSWIDPTKEVAAYKEAIKGGLLTLTEAVAQDGRDFDEMLQIRKREIDLCDEAEVLFDTDWANSQAVMQSEISQQQVDNQSTTDQTDATA